MNLTRWTLLSPVLVSLTTLALGADWPPISDADRSLTSIAEQPGAPAVILMREQTDDNMNNLLMVYERIKILTDAGRKYATIDLPYSRAFSIATLSGRTVHADGSVTPVAGKPFDKTVNGTDGLPVTVKAFTLPDAEAGSIIDFRYSLRYMDHRVFPPEWEVQTNLFQRQAYFKFIPLQNRGYASVQLDHGQLARNLAWTPFLGKGAQPEMHTLPAKTFATVHDVLLWVDLNVTDVPPVIEEPFMPPASLLKWRVYFYYQATLKAEDYWKNEGKFWNKDVEVFLGRNDGVAAAVAKVASPTDTAEQKVQKIYSFVSGLKNVSSDPKFEKQRAYALEYRSAECIMESGISGIAASGGPAGCVQTESSPAEQKRQARGARDVLQDGSGTHDELNRLFVAMVRAAGVSASLMWVPDRSERAFLKEYLSTDQLDGEITIVQLDQKDVFLDPGTKFCPYGTIDWRYSSAMGLRQNANAAEFGETPALDYKQSLTTRKADLVVDQNGELTGTVSLFFKGVPAMVRRQAAETADAEVRKKILEDELSGVLRGKSEVELVNSPDWNGTETPLVGQFRVRVALPTLANKELSLAQDLFQGAKPWFPAAARSNAIDFRYPWQEADEVRVSLPEGVEVEKLASDDSLAIGYARYRIQHKQEAANKLYARRDFIMGTGLVSLDRYKELKEFFDKVNTDDAQTTLLKLSEKVVGSN